MSTIKSSTTTTTAYSVSADTTGTLVIQTGSTPTTAVTVGTDQSVTLAGTLALQSQNMSPYTGFKNRIINGAMVIDQRNAGAAVTPTTNVYSLDRWEFYVTQASKVTFQQNAGSVTPLAGFKNYLGFTVGASANVTVGATDLFLIDQYIEGYNIADLGFGAAGASTVTLSFWVRSSLTGIFGGSLTNSGNARSYPFTYTISSANTWEQKTITVAGDTSGTWLSTNGTGLGVRFSIGTGSTYLGTSGSWAGAGYFGATGQTNLVTTNSATFYITGVQLEKGSTATSFDYRPYGTELALCQRYYQVLPTWSYDGYAAGAGQFGYAVLPFAVAMRAAPSVATGTQTGGTANNGGPAAIDITATGCSMRVQSSGSGRFYYLTTTGANAAIEL